MLYTILYHPKVKTDDIPRLSTSARESIQKAIERRLTVDPEKYGLPLRRGLKGYRKLRVGDYRVIYKIADDEIRIILIGHRKDIYSKTWKRT